MRQLQENENVFTSSFKAFSKKDTLRELAIEWLELRDNFTSGLIHKVIFDFEKELILEKAKARAQEIVFTSRAKTLVALTLSYFCGINSSAKIVKGKKANFDTLVLYLSASKNAGIDICKSACAQCRALCLVASGRAEMEKNRDASKRKIAIARVIKTWLVVFNPLVANQLIQSEIEKESKRSARIGNQFAIRLNGTSDLDFSEIIRSNPEKTFYDYTKRSLESVESFPNYSLTYSYANFSKARIDQYKLAHKRGINIAVAISKADFSKAIDSHPKAYDADSSDLRFKDKTKGGYALLSVKGSKGKGAETENGFVLTARGFEQLVSVIEKE